MLSENTSPRRGILAGGNWLIDHVKVIDAWPEQDGLAEVITHSMANGGGPYNVLKDLVRMKAPFPLEAAGLVGDDEDGRLILADCSNQGITTTQLHTTTKACTSYSDVMTVRGTGRRTFFHHRGANTLLEPAHFDFTSTQAKRFHLGYLLLLDKLDELDNQGLPRVVALLRRAREAGLATSIDCVSSTSASFRRTVAPALPYTDVLFANDFEAEQLTGLALGRGKELRRVSVEAAAHALAKAGVRDWALVHFPEGVCACAPSGELFWQGSVKVPSEYIIGAAGAGDALAAGVLLGLHEGWPMPRCLELGVCTAATCLFDSTTSGGVLPSDECLKLGRELGFR